MGFFVLPNIKKRRSQCLPPPLPFFLLALVRIMEKADAPFGNFDGLPPAVTNDQRFYNNCVLKYMWIQVSEVGQLLKNAASEKWKDWVAQCDANTFLCALCVKIMYDACKDGVDSKLIGHRMREWCMPTALPGIIPEIEGLNMYLRVLFPNSSLNGNEQLETKQFMMIHTITLEGIAAMARHVHTLSEPITQDTWKTFFVYADPEKIMHRRIFPKPVSNAALCTSIQTLK